MMPSLPARSLSLASLCLLWLAPRAAAVPQEVPLHQLSDRVYHTEHCLFLLDTERAADWPAYQSVFAEERRQEYVDELRRWFPDDYFAVVLIANNLQPNYVPWWEPLRFKASGIGMDFGRAGVADQGIYNLGGGRVGSEALAVLDHEIGHAWGVVIPPGNGHWPANSTIRGQMAAYSSDDDYDTARIISGNRKRGFTWRRIDLFRENQRRTYSKQTLYAMGLAKKFPVSWLLNDPVYNADHSMSYSSVERFDHRTTVAAVGKRVPSYRESEKRFRVGFVFVVRHEAELLESYQGIEESIAFHCNGTTVDPLSHMFEVPFLVGTQFRASLDCRLADLDGNVAPELRIADPYVKIRRGETARIGYELVDPDGRSEIRCLEAPGTCKVRETEIVISGLRKGTHFLTVRAQDEGGKTTYGHFVVDVRK